jgi:hypothetical protein
LGLFSSAISVFARIAFRFEFFFPQFIGFYMGRKLKEYKNKGLLADYQVKSNRRGKYHYLFDMDMFLNIPKGGEIPWLKKRRKDT